MSLSPAAGSEPAPLRWLHRITCLWAIAGGVILLAITGLEAVNALLKLGTGAAHPAEHELVKYLVGIAIFSFLPWCQISDGHVTVDIFSQRAGPRVRAMMAAAAAVAGVAIAALLLRQMALGMQSYQEYREVTAVLKLPIWTAFPFVLISLALWCLAALASLWRALGALRKGA